MIWWHYLEGKTSIWDITTVRSKLKFVHLNCLKNRIASMEYSTLDNSVRREELLEH